MRRLVCLSLAGLVVLGVANAGFAMMMCGTGGHGSKAEAAEPAKEEVADVGNTACPISGDKVDGKTTYEYEGKTYNFCCPSCIDEFKKDTQKYIDKLEAAEKEEAAEKKEPAGHEGHTGHSGHHH